MKCHLVVENKVHAPIPPELRLAEDVLPDNEPLFLIPKLIGGNNQSSCKASQKMAQCRVSQSVHGKSQNSLSCAISRHPSRNHARSHVQESERRPGQKS